MSRIANSVEKLLRKPNWCLERMSFSLKKFKVLTETSYSKSLPKAGNREIGRYDVGFSLSPPLNNGTTCAILKDWKNTRTKTFIKERSDKRYDCFPCFFQNSVGDKIITTCFLIFERFNKIRNFFLTCQ